MKWQPGDVVSRTARGVEIVYSPAQGARSRYSVRCPHGEFVRARTQAEAREDARDVDEWCDECRSPDHPISVIDQARQLGLEFLRSDELSALADFNDTERWVWDEMAKDQARGGKDDTEARRIADWRRERVRIFKELAAAEEQAQTEYEAENAT